MTDSGPTSEGTNVQPSAPVGVAFATRAWRAARASLARRVAALAARGGDALRRPGPETTPREERARRALEGLLAVALALSAVDLARSRAGSLGDGSLGDGSRREDGPSSGPLPSVAIDVARDPPWALRLLPSVGRTRAEAILADRARNGPVPNVPALARVPGLGAKSVAALEAAGAVVGAGERAPAARSRGPPPRNGPRPPATVASPPAVSAGP